MDAAQAWDATAVRADLSDRIEYRGTRSPGLGDRIWPVGAGSAAGDDGRELEEVRVFGRRSDLRQHSGGPVRVGPPFQRQPDAEPGDLALYRAWPYRRSELVHRPVGR